MTRRPISPRSRQRLLATVAVVALAAAGGCSSARPLAAEDPVPPALETIRDAFVASVAATRDDPDYDWHHGPLGNTWVNIRGGDTRGLCYDWQERVYVDVRETAADVGWSAVGVVINFDTSHEHHAVIVHDPRRVREEDLLPPAPMIPAWVLDPWRTGKPYVYRLHEWAEMPAKVEVPPALEDLDTIVGPAPGAATR